MSNNLYSQIMGQHKKNGNGFMMPNKTAYLRHRHLLRSTSSSLASNVNNRSDNVQPNLKCETNVKTSNTSHSQKSIEQYLISLVSLEKSVEKREAKAEQRAVRSEQREKAFMQSLNDQWQHNRKMQHVIETLPHAMNNTIRTQISEAVKDTTSETVNSIVDSIKSTILDPLVHTIKDTIHEAVCGALSQQTHTEPVTYDNTDTEEEDDETIVLQPTRRRHLRRAHFDQNVTQALTVIVEQCLPFKAERKMYTKIVAKARVHPLLRQYSQIQIKNKAENILRNQFYQQTEN